MKIKMILPNGYIVKTMDDGIEYNDKMTCNLACNLRLYLDENTTICKELDNGEYIVLNGRAKENTIYFIEK